MSQLIESMEPVGNCSNAISCPACVQEPVGCVWCLLSGSCIPVSQGGQCTNPYTDCCVTFSPQGCGTCLKNPTCGWCSNQGCRQGNKTGPNGGTGPCTGSWTFGGDGSCPQGDGEQDTQDLAELIGVGVAVAFGTCFALFVLILLVILVVKRWRQREAQKDLIQYERRVRRKSAHIPMAVNAQPSEFSSSPSSYSSLAPLIRDWNIEQGNTDYETLKRVEEATKD